MKIQLTGTVLAVGTAALLAMNPALASSTSAAAADSSAPATVQCKGANGVTSPMTEEECKKSGGTVDPNASMPSFNSQGGMSDTNNSSQSTDSHQ